jgi:hypothetical protein
LFVPRAGSTAKRIRVLWDVLGPKLISCEDEQDLRRRYPEAPTWGQAGGKGGGNVMTKETGSMRE